VLLVNKALRVLLATKVQLGKREPLGSRANRDPLGKKV
jgi:hypothetical protein